MRVRDNRLGSVFRFFSEELSGIYERGEIQALFCTAAEHYLGWTRTQVSAGMGENINQSDLLRLYDCAKALARHQPLQYILGVAWFCDMRLIVNRDVLIPRPETEELVHHVLREFVQESATVLDIGTGSGCIALAIKRARQAYKVGGCDISLRALDVARTNSLITGIDVSFYHCDILNNELPENYDLIVSNPPYIAPSESGSMAENVIAHEPHQALFAPAADPVLFYRKIIDICPARLNRGGMLFFELNPANANEVSTYAGRSGIFSRCAVVKDMSGKQRFLYALKS